MAIQLLQMPIIGWARAAVGLFYIYLSNAGVVFHHIQCAMAQLGFQRKQIAARPEIGDGEGVAKAMGMTFLDAGFLAQRDDQLPECIPLKGSVVFDQEQGRVDC